MIVTLDKKGRVFIPKKLRKDFEGNLLVTQQKTNLLLFKKEAWGEYKEKLIPSLDGDVKKAYRMICSKTYETYLDNQGRTLIPSNLRKFKSNKLVIKKNKKYLIIKEVRE